MSPVSRRKPFQSRTVLIGLGVTVVAGLVLLVNASTRADLTTFGGLADHRVGANSIDSGTDGTCSGTSFSTPTGNFTSADVGKAFVVTGDTNSAIGALEGSDGGSYPLINPPLRTHVVSVQDSTHVTLNDGCVNTITGTAQWDIGTDNTVALQTCVSSGDCDIPAGNYLLGAGVQLTQDGGTVHCEPGAVLFFPRHDTLTDAGLPSALNVTDVSDVTVENCTFVGTNLHQSFDYAEGNRFIQIEGSARRNTIAGNVFTNGWSDGDILMQGNSGVQAPCTSASLSGDAVPGVPSRNVITNNTHSNCGLNGIALTTGNYNTFSGNHLTNCNFDIEPNDECINGPVFHNVVTGNSVTAADGPRSPPVTDAHGTHLEVFFSGCAARPCPDAGGPTIDVHDNDLIGPVYVYPYCVDGVISQAWQDNRALSPGGATCIAGDTGCVRFPDCTPPAASSSLPKLIVAPDGGVAGILFD